MPYDRQPAVAGAFYPANPAVLGRQVDELLAAAAVIANHPDTYPAIQPKALIAPHAGGRGCGAV